MGGTDLAKLSELAFSNAPAVAALEEEDRMKETHVLASCAVVWVGRWMGGWVDEL